METKNNDNGKEQEVSKNYDKQHGTSGRNMHGRESKKNSSGNQGSENN